MGNIKKSSPSYDDIKKNNDINKMIEKGNSVLNAIGYTEHSHKHASIVAETAARLLSETGRSEKLISLAKIAGYMHDIGNCVNRNDHAHTGAILAFQILKELGMPVEDILTVTSAIGNHDESTGQPVDEVSAALILADKTDVRRSRVQNTNAAAFDSHDRVNYAVLSNKIVVNEDKKVIRLELALDDKICSVMDYFEIFLGRMIMCKRAAELLGYKFKITANGSKLC